MGRTIRDPYGRAGGTLASFEPPPLNIPPGYHDYRGDWIDIPPETRSAIEEIITSKGEVPSPTALVVKAGDTRELPERGTIVLEDGSSIEGVQAVPAHTPPGYHRFEGNRVSLSLIVGPGRCFLPEKLRIWGWALQLYPLWSRKSWGIGDLADLKTLGRWASELGAEAILLNPLHAPTPVLPQQPSPYYPSSRCFKDPIYLRIEDVPGAEGLEDLDRLAAAGRSLSTSERVDRDTVFGLKLDALERIWQSNPPGREFDLHLRRSSAALGGFATFCALARRFGGDWREWPSEYRHPDSPAVTRFRDGNEIDIWFHAWLQWLLDAQFEGAGREIGVVNDLAIGVDPAGADAWLWQDSFATGASIGAPPDDYNLEGQDWGVLGFDPYSLAAAGYEPFIEMIRSSMRHAAGMRFDHVMGLFRLFWIPDGVPAKHGGYVPYPADDLLEILALESQRAQAYVIGEDLGTVEDVVREQMAARDMLSYKLLWFYDDDLDTLPYRAMASTNTHDLPTTFGLWTGSDLARQESLGMKPSNDFSQTMIDRIVRHLGVGRDASVAEVVDAACGALARSESAIVTVALEDLVEAEERYNFPGSVGEWNWSARLPVPLEDIVGSNRGAEIADIFRPHRTT